MITYSGVQMNPGCKNVPTAMDIAVGMCRITRYAGALWVPLAAHSVLVADFACQQSKSPLLFAWGLLHDAHETVTGEVTRHFKPKEMKAFEGELDELIFKDFGLLIESYRNSKSEIKAADEAALCAEATLNGLIGWPAYYERMEGRKPPELSTDELERAQAILNFWSVPMMVETESLEIRRLTYALSKVKVNDLTEARRACLPGGLI